MTDQDQVIIGGGRRIMDPRRCGHYYSDVNNRNEASRRRNSQVLVIDAPCFRRKTSVSANRVVLPRKTFHKHPNDEISTISKAVKTKKIVETDRRRNSSVVASVLLAVGLIFFISAISLTVDAQRVNVTLFTESQCPFCTRLLREQIWQFHTRWPGIMNLQIIPFGKGDCQFTNDRRLICRCMHGPTECDLNRLQNCAISYFPRRFIGLVICIQGLKNLGEAYQRCLSRLSPRTQQRLKQCAQTQTGEVLNYYSMLNTHRAGVRIWPTAYVNGRFFDRSYPMEVKICENTNWC